MKEKMKELIFNFTDELGISPFLVILIVGIVFFIIEYKSFKNWKNNDFFTKASLIGTIFAIILGIVGLLTV